MRLDELYESAMAVLSSPEGMGDRQNFSASYVEDLHKARSHLFLYDLLCEAIRAYKINYPQSGIDNYISDFISKYRRARYAVPMRKYPYDSGNFYVRLDTDERFVRLVFDFLFAYFSRVEGLKPEIQFGVNFWHGEDKTPISFDCFCSFVCNMREDVEEFYHLDGPIGKRIKFVSRINPRSKNDIEMEVQREHFEHKQAPLRAKLLTIRDQEEERLLRRTNLIKKLGAPYQPTFTDYMRYLRTNCQVMQTKNGDFFLLLDDILETGVPLL